MSGLLDYQDGNWHVTGMPGHVSLRFKHVFSGLGIASIQPFRLKDTPDRASDLDWFMSRYPLQMTPAAAERMSAALALYRGNRDKLEHLMKADYVPGLIKGIREPEVVDPHQARAAELIRTTGRLLLLDDVGLGKTLSSLAAHTEGWGLPAIVVVQPHVADQWEAAIHRFTHLSTCKISSKTPHELEPADIYIFRYTNIAGWVDMFPKMNAKTVIFDEIQELRHGTKTEKGKGAQALIEATENHVGLTATPIYNYGDEMFTVINYIAPDCLGTRDEFRINWCRQQGNHWIVQDPEALGAYLQTEGLALRRTEDDAEVQLTQLPLRRQVIQVAWNEGDVDTDRELQRKLAQRVLTGSYTERGLAARELDIMMRQETGIAKARSVAAYVRNLVEMGEAVILGGWHREVYRILTECLSDLRVVMFTGSETQVQKRRAKEAIMNGEADVIIISLRSGAGLDGLQEVVANVVLGELDWSPEVHKQLIGRARRRGQARQVTAHFLWTDGGSDPVIMSMLGLKASQADGILNPWTKQPTEIAAPQLDESRIRVLAKAVLDDATTAVRNFIDPLQADFDLGEVEFI